MSVSSSTSSNGPVGVVLGPGSTGLRLTDRESQVAELVGLGYSHKKIGRALGMTAATSAVIVSQIATRIPGEGSAKVKVCAWVWTYGHSLHEGT